MKRLALSAAAALLALSLLAPPIPAQDVPESTRIERGARLYRATGCWQCHGTEGQGGVGPRVGPDALPLPVFAAYVRRPTGDMPGYGPAVLSDEDMAALHAFLLARPGPATIPPPHGVPGR